MIVDPNSTKFQRGREAHGTSDILGEDRGSESVLDIVRQMNRCGFFIKFLNCDDGSEDFVLHDFPILLNVCNDGGLKVVAARESLGNAAACQDLCALCLGTIHKARNAFALNTRDQGDPSARRLQKASRS